MGNTRLQVLPVWELEMRRLRADAPRIATRRVKWNLQFQKRRGVKIGPARDLPPELERLLVKTSKRVYRLLQLSGFARIDFRLDAEGRPFFLEANPNADIGYGEEFAEAAGCRHRLRTVVIAFSPFGIRKRWLLASRVVSQPGLRPPRTPPSGGA
jgi:D-alanine-D-alanine ligase